MGAPGAALTSDRFTILGRLGEGGMGVVYRALDMVLGVEVAVKLLSRAGGRDLYRFKREFRALAEVGHPNLVRLHELFVQADQWFFSMELIDGTPLGRHVRPDATTPIDLELLRATFGQLADAVMAIHALGKLHRDLKPSNVLVERDGRVVVLDFGLVRAAEAGDLERTHEAMAVGTPGYMSPEQARDLPLGPASDWYAVGVMLYEALTGARPFSGTAAEVMLRRNHEDPPPPRQLDPSVPEDLERACMALLHREPAARADGRALLEVLGRAPSAATLAIEKLAAPTPFVGRAREMAQLREAFAQAEDGSSVFVPITGPPGIGKTVLIHHFLDSLDPADALVFRARCYERESVPFQAIDSLVDVVASRLLALAPTTLETILPRDISALARLFPTLHRVPQIAAPRMPSLLPKDHVEVRRRAVVAFGALLASLAGRQTLVVFLDDLQWSDADAGAVLADLVRSFEDIGALFLVATRAGEEGMLAPTLAPALGGDRGAPTVRLPAGATEPSAPSGLVIRELIVGPMPQADSRALFAAMAPASTTAPDDDISDEAAGVPYFLAELARSSSTDDVPSPSLDQLVESRIERVSADARALLEVCTVAARPLFLDVAAVVSGGDPAEALAALRNERLVHTERRRNRHVLEPAHDRVRAAVMATIAPERQRAINAKLAAALEGRPETEPADLVGHWLAAGERANAARHAAAAAAAAEDGLAFHRAADLYELALEAPDLDDNARNRLRLRMSECLAAVGRLDAAIAILDAAAHDATGSARREIKRFDVELALRAGDFARGVTEARALCAELGHRVPVGRTGTIAAIVAQELLLRLRGIGYKARAAADVPAEELEKIDTLFGLTSGLAYVQPALGRLIQLYHLRAALAAGEPGRISRALSLEQPHFAQGGSAVMEKLLAVEARARALVDELDRPDLRGLNEAACAISCGTTGRWRESADHARTAESLLRDHARGMRWTLNLAQLYRVFGHWFRGDTHEVVRLVPTYVTEAEELGDAHGLGLMRVGRGNMYWLITDRPADARAMAEAGFPRRDRVDDFHLHDYFHAITDLHIELYDGNPRRATTSVETIWPRFSKSLIRRIQFLRVELLNARARAAVAAAAELDGDADARSRLLELGRHALVEVAREASPWGDALALATHAAIAHQSGSTDDAIAICLRAITAAEATDLNLHVHALRWRLGEWRGGDAGAALITAASAWMTERKIANPAAIVRMLTAGGRRA